MGDGVPQPQGECDIPFEVRLGAFGKRFDTWLGSLHRLDVHFRQ
jgi:hypothetical protein